jgi:phospholipase/carboxylesterase
MAGLNVWIAGRREPEGEQEPRIVVMLHGFAKPRETLLIMAEREATKFGTIFIFPEAPVALDWRRRAWWRPRSAVAMDALEGWSPRNGRPGRRTKTVLPDQEVVAARRQVISLLAEVRRRFEVRNDELLLAGFSQGATLALDVALHLKEPVGGLAFLSGKPLDPAAYADSLDRLDDVPVLIAHGRYDPLASFSAVDRMRRAMKRAGIDVVWVPYDGGHDISQSAQWQLRKFIRGTTEATASNLRSVVATDRPENSTLAETGQEP